MQAIDNHNVFEPLVLTPRQRAVLDALKDKETKEYPVSKWYLGALYALENPYNPDRVSQAAQSLRELLEKLPRVVQGSDVQGSTFDFKGMRRNIYERILQDKKRYPSGWQDEKIDGHLNKTLRKVEEYVERNQQPTRKEQMQRAVATIDPMVNQFDSEIQETKRNRLHDLWKRLEGFAHHQESEPDVEGFRVCLEELESIVFDLLAPITAQDQEEIQTILRRSDRSERDVERMFSLIERRGANFVFFFKYAAETADVSWLPLLKERGYFAHPPSVEPLGDGRVYVPFWDPMRYLEKMSDHAPDEVIELVLQIPKVDNPMVYGEILEIALQLPGEQSARLKPKILESVVIDSRFWIPKYADLLAHWIAESQISAALELSRVLVQFVPDPQSETKQERRKEDPTDPGTLWETSLEPSPQFETWEYSEIMSKGVRPLTEREPYQVACILIDATANMIRLQTHQENLNEEADSSGAWCERLDGSDSDYGDPEKTLVHTLTFACEQVYEKSPDSVVALDETLRNQQWWIFKRLRQHLYAKYPSEKTKPWIRELILMHEDYNRWDYHYEFGQMIQSACEHFGETLFTKAERIRIFDAILSGPSKTDFRKWLKKWRGEEFTEEQFQQRQCRFHWKQLRPFASVLFGKYEASFQKLESAANAPISDEDNQLSPESLANLTDEDLLTYINEWDKKDYLYKNRGPIGIGIEKGPGAFQTVFKESIIPYANRLRFWMKNHEKIENPTYVQAMINVMRELVTAKNFDNLNEWLRFCEWVLLHIDRGPEDHDKQGCDSQERPKWYDSRWAVGDFIEACLEENIDIPVSAWGQLVKLLDMLCTQFDWHLDRDSDRNDPIDEALNNLRSRALQNLIKFGFWLQERGLESEVSEVTTILEKRFALEAECPLTLPEYAILGKIYNRIYDLNEAWATEHKSDFFPQGNLPAWMAAFGSFVRYNRPFKRTFEICRDDFNFALQHLADFKKRGRPGEKQKGSFGWPLQQNSPEAKLIESLGRHLFYYYLWGMYPLRGEESLLERYYQATNNNREQWANLFNYVGSVLQNTNEQLDKSLKDRIIAFFDWRLEVQEPTELGQFALWLEAKCLEAEWRLDSFSKILDACKTKDVSIHIRLKALCELLPNYTEKVVECFAKLTDCIGDNNVYIPVEEAKIIMKTGLESDDESIRQNAEHARENLLREGRFDLLDIDVG